MPTSRQHAGRARSIGILAAVLALASCATAYQPRGATGGYQERQLSASRWYVEFFGNGKTRRDTVFGYWLNRCAELTVEKGYDHFVLISKEPRTAQIDSSIAYTASRAPSYTYMPSASSQPVTTWSARGTIELRRGEADPRDPRQQDARALLAKLAPYMQQARAQGNMTLPEGLIAATEEAESAPPGASPVRLEDLQGLLPVQKQ